jgi:hypothetical protein
MPINVNSQLITAISCEGREIIRAHAGLDLVWAKASPVPSDLVNINGVLWTSRHLTWDDGGSGIIKKIPFADGVEYYYYNRVAILRYLAANPQYRLPDISDFAALEFTPAYTPANAYCKADLMYWSSIHASMRNAFDMQFVASGRVYINTIQVVRLNMQIARATSSGDWLNFSNMAWSSTGFNYYGAMVNYYFPVRLIYTP